MNNKSLGVYKKSSLEAELSVADPHKVIQLLMQGFWKELHRQKAQLSEVTIS